MVKLGFSMYVSSGKEKNLEIVQKASKAGLKYAFTSLHIPEESDIDLRNEMDEVFELCKTSGISIIADISPRTVEKLGLSSIEDLQHSALSHLRMDYGFENEEIIRLSRMFNVVFNSSTLLPEQLNEFKSLNADFTRLKACHNFYPKPRTGLSLEKVRSINERLSFLGITNMAFVAGDKERRAPLKQGLPTVEAHRDEDVLLSILQLITMTSTDIVLIGDVDVTDQTWDKLKDLSEGFVRLKCSLDIEYAHLNQSCHHDRPDSSDYVIRSVESRMYATPGVIIEPKDSQPIQKGDILIGNRGYLRYSGELEVARVDLGMESRVNVIGKVDDEYIKYLPYIQDGLGFILEVSE
ncbi:MAG: DUF871 domain-containing protein [Firmicutes bacterium HGW-Firmicutes-20]|jgi:hypothetical protein|nr:MAG: DUF871 domain-containing protein [Firmicutes bacterium HGW-Firmicutes-20]PKM69615.1 MAG: DUF871 domain-containing protein [Firmicutes bacterium HGW-Firmicutes-19]